MSLFRKIAALALIGVLATALTACGASSNGLPGTGTEGVTEKIEWSRYDDLMEASTKEVDAAKRALLLHEAEDMLINAGAVVPVSSSVAYMLIKPDVTGVDYENNGMVDLTRIEKAGANADEPVKVCIGTEVSKIDPPADTTFDLMCIVENTSANLLKKDTNDVIHGELAESWSVSDDGLTYTFVMRGGLKWSDGTELDAKDFEYSWKRSAASENAFDYGVMFDCISGYPDDLDVEASDDGKTLTVKLANPTAFFKELVCLPCFAPVQRKQVESAEGYKDASGKLLNPSAWAVNAPLVSNGAYVVDEWVHNEHITLKKNPYYYKADEVKTDTVILMLSADSASAYSAYVSDAISVLYGKVPADELANVKDSPEFHVYEKKATSYVLFNVAGPLFEGMTKEEAVTFRKALGNAIDRQFVADVINPGAITPSGTFVPMNISDGTGNRFGDTEGFEYPEEGGYYNAQPDLEKSREMLKSIGFEFGDDGKLKKPITIEYMYPANADNEARAVALQADLAQLGINISLSSREWAVYLGELNSGNFEMGPLTWNADFDDPYNFLSLFTTDSPNNRAQLGK